MIRFTGSNSPFHLTKHPPLNQNALSPAEQIQGLAIQHGLLRTDFPPSPLVDVLRTLKFCDPGSPAVQEFIAELNIMRSRISMEEETAELIDAFQHDMDEALSARLVEGLTRCEIVNRSAGNPKSSVFAALLDYPPLAFHGLFGRAEQERVRDARELRLVNEGDVSAFSDFVKKALEFNPGLVPRLYATLAKQNGRLEKECLDAMLQFVREGETGMMISVFMCVRRLHENIQYETWLSLIGKICAWPDRYHESVAEILFLRPLSPSSFLDDPIRHADDLRLAAQAFSELGSTAVAAALKAVACHILAQVREPAEDWRLGTLYRSLILLPEAMQGLPAPLKKWLETEEAFEQSNSELLDILIAAPRSSMPNELVIAAIDQLLRHKPLRDIGYLAQVTLFIGGHGPYSDEAYSKILTACGQEVQVHADLLSFCTTVEQLKAWHDATDRLPSEDARLVMQGEEYRNRLKWARYEIDEHNDIDVDSIFYFDDLSSLTSPRGSPFEDAESSVSSIGSHSNPDLSPRLLGRLRRRPSEDSAT